MERITDWESRSVPSFAALSYSYLYFSKYSILEYIYIYINMNKHILYIHLHLYTITGATMFEQLGEILCIHQWLNLPFMILRFYYTNGWMNVVWVIERTRIECNSWLLACLVNIYVRRLLLKGNNECVKDMTMLVTFCGQVMETMLSNRYVV